ncbi:1-acyl-sn-glycerol-3-phosphate acyltransferase [Thalassiella azotivora]
MRLPPRWVRRVVLAPAVLLLTTLLLVTCPLWLLAAALLSPLIPGRWRPLRLLWMVALYLMLESAALVALFALWVASGFGRRIRTPAFERTHYDLVLTILRVLYTEAVRVLKVDVRVEGPEPTAATGRPLLVFSRHAGPGDSFLLVHALLSWYDREPRIVLKDTLQWDPAIDVLLNRLPNRFIRPGGGGGARDGRVGTEEHVRALATGLDDDDAFVIFPEGGNFTEQRRARSITRLREKGLLGEAEKAERMRHVLAPRPGGVVAALDAAPGADVVWVAHSGVEDLLGVADVWRALPMDVPITMRWFHVPGDQVPTGREEQVRWLYEWWARIDGWVADQLARRGAA